MILIRIRLHFWDTNGSLLCIIEIIHSNCIHIYWTIPTTAPLNWIWFRQLSVHCRRQFFRPLSLEPPYCHLTAACISRSSVPHLRISIHRQLCSVILLVHFSRTVEHSSAILFFPSFTQYELSTVILLYHFSHTLRTDKVSLYLIFSQPWTNCMTPCTLWWRKNKHFPEKMWLLRSITVTDQTTSSRE